MTRLGVLVVAACAAPPPPAGPKPVVIGETFTLDSRVLGERRTINVYLPPDYATSTARYPVLYEVDGGIKEDFPLIAGLIDVSIKNEVITPRLVVGIEGIERRKDLAGPTTVPDEMKAAPHAGGADRYRRFLREELKPYIAAHYRVTAESGIAGESLAGLFIIETLLVDPTLFDSYIAADPAVYWNNQAAVSTAADVFAHWARPGTQVYIATGDLPEMQSGVLTLMTAYANKNPPGLGIKYEPMPEEHHATIFPIAAVHGFRTLYAKPTAAAP